MSRYCSPIRSRAAETASAKPALAPLRKTHSVSNQASLARLRTKLTIGAVNDPLEHEADAVADRVMRTPAPDLSLSSAPAQMSRKCAAREEEDKQKMQRKEAAGAASGVGTAPPIVGQALSEPGAPLDSAMRSFFEPRFGFDFSSVRVHANSTASQSAEATRAEAYAVGDHIVFGANRYPPQTESGRHLLAHELAHVLQQGNGQSTPLRRAPPTNPPAPAAPPAGAKKNPTQCNFNCDDTSFLASPLAEREAQFDQSCPDSFPPANKTAFFGQPIPAETGTMLRTKLLQAQSLAMRDMCLQGKDPHGYTLDRRIGTYPSHSGGIDKSVDIDTEGQPFIMHENSSDAAMAAGERAIDRETGPVFDRISFWENGRKSVIPGGITSVARVPGGSGTQRTWTDPATGQANTPVTTGEIYDRLDEENMGMRGYFLLLEKNDAQLKAAIAEVLAADPTRAAGFAPYQLPTDATDASAQAFRKRLAEDTLIVGGSKAQLADLTDDKFAKATNALPDHPGDRPFQGGARAYDPLAKTQVGATANRRPELGFLSLPREVVVALTAVGLRWGAIDFGGESGDVMHFDCNNIPGC